MRHKFEVKELRREKEKLIKELTSKLLSESPVKIAEPVAEKKVCKVDSVLKIDAKIKETYLLIEYLEKVEKIFSSMTFDIKNVTEIMKLETT
jgi:phenylalanyl-tRNA synthetase alpha subunit